MEKKIQQVFSRYESKYLVQPTQSEALLARLNPMTVADMYGNYTICSIYFDTEDFSLVRTSVEKPVYKEKLRLRSYGIPKADDPVFVELKRKYDGVVYKRRATMTCREASDYFLKGRYPSADSQIMREIDWFVGQYQPVPKSYIAYDRTALSGLGDQELRITFDRNIRWRDKKLDLMLGDWGEPLLTGGAALMEIKSAGSVPLWLSHLLSELQIYPASYSKYGACYKEALIHDFLKTEVYPCA